MEAETYDAIVIGSGQGGRPLSIALAKAGWKTAIVERELLLNSGVETDKQSFVKVNGNV